ncbi:MAG: hypothetical protein HKM04_03040 [Legionellales bacterium]|nr:hypothetical protein [Legionellales bacterium]
MIINDTDLGIALFCLLVLLAITMVLARRRHKKDELEMPEVEKDFLLDKNTSTNRANTLDVGRWGDQIVGAPRVISSETLDERIDRIHQKAEEHHQRHSKGHSQYAPITTPASIHQRPAQPKQQSFEDSISRGIFVLYVMARDKSQFTGNDLYQSLINAGLVYGQNRIFHYHEKNGGKGVPLFAAASAINPGIIDLNHLEAFRTPGITLFMDTSKIKYPKVVLETMIAVAEQLADDLDAVVLNANRVAWSTEVEAACFAQFG